MQFIAQVDMDVRIHRNQSIESLRKMSYVILSILLHRSEQLGKIALLERMGHQLHFIRREDEGYVYDAEDISSRERPPMISIPAYQERYGLQRGDTALVEAYQLPRTGRSCFSQLPEESFIQLELNSRSREEVIQELIGLPAAVQRLDQPEEIVRGLLNRERRLSTNVGHGVAIPHLVTSQVDDTLILFGRSAQGIDFRSSIINRPVYLIFIILSPPHKQAEYLQTLTCLARLLRHRKVIQDFREVSTPSEAIALMKKYDALINLQTQLKLRLLI
jgi:mannitol/fructose-specific phosphotransferase system IIA component (Ntr-type)